MSSLTWIVVAMVVSQPLTTAGVAWWVARVVARATALTVWTVGAKTAGEVYTRWTAPRALTDTQVAALRRPRSKSI